MSVQGNKHGKNRRNRGEKGLIMKERLSGNEAIAYAMKQIEPDVVPAFPITPSTEITQYFSQYIASRRSRYRVYSC